MSYLMVKVFNDTLTDDIVSFEQLGPDIPSYLERCCVRFQLYMLRARTCTDGIRCVLTDVKPEFVAC